jgi:hypothetical protein
VDKLLGILLPRHLDPRPDQEEDQPEGSKAKKKKAKKKAAKKEGPKADAAGQDQGTEEGAAAQDKVEGADGLVTYFYVLELFTVTLPYFCEWRRAWAKGPTGRGCVHPQRAPCSRQSLPGTLTDSLSSRQLQTAQGYAARRSSGLQYACRVVWDLLQTLQHAS